jgi:hypothetical protein
MERSTASGPKQSLPQNFGAAVPVENVKSQEQYGGCTIARAAPAV